MKTNRFTVKLSDEERELLSRLATQEHESISVIVRQAVKDYARRRGGYYIAKESKSAEQLSRSAGAFTV